MPRCYACDGRGIVWTGEVSEDEQGIIQTYGLCRVCGGTGIGVAPERRTGELEDN